VQLGLPADVGSRWAAQALQEVRDLSPAAGKLVGGARRRDRRGLDADAAGVAAGGRPRLFRKCEISALPPGNSSVEPGGATDEDSMPMQLAWLPASANVVVGEAVLEANKHKSPNVMPSTSVSATRRISTSLGDLWTVASGRDTNRCALVMPSEALLSSHCSWQTCSLHFARSLRRCRSRPRQRRPGPAGRLRRHHRHHEADGAIHLTAWGDHFLECANHPLGVGQLLIFRAWEPPS